MSAPYPKFEGMLYLANPFVLYPKLVKMPATAEQPWFPAPSYLMVYAESPKRRGQRVDEMSLEGS